MKSSQIYIILCLALLWTRCAQNSMEEGFPEPFEGDPVFTVSAYVGGELLMLAAGLEDYYMFTSYERDEEEVLVFKGDLRQQSCPESCAEQLRIEIRNDETSEEEEVKVDSALIYGLTFSSIATPQPITYKVNFRTTDISPNESIVSYQWNFGDGTTSNEADPIHEYIEPSQYFVELKTEDSNGCQSSQRQVIDLQSLDGSCAIQIEGSFVQGNFIELEATSSFESQNMLYLWEGDSVSLNSTFVFSTGIYCVQLENQSACAANSCAGVLLDSIPAYCTTSFVYDIESTTTDPGNPQQLGTITVVYTDEAGQEYRSDLGSQDEAVLQIQGLEDFDDNENGEKTKKIDFQLSCLLYGENGDILELTDGIFNFGVAHP